MTRQIPNVYMYSNHAVTVHVLAVNYPIFHARILAEFCGFPSGKQQSGLNQQVK